MKCKKCKKEIKSCFTSSDNKEICKECLEKEIYVERHKIYKNMKKESLKRRLKKIMDYLLIGIFIGFAICYFVTMVIMIIKELVR